MYVFVEMGNKTCIDPIANYVTDLNGIHGNICGFVSYAVVCADSQISFVYYIPSY